MSLTSSKLELPRHDGLKGNETSRGVGKIKGESPLLVVSQRICGLGYQLLNVENQKGGGSQKGALTEGGEPGSC